MTARKPLLPILERIAASGPEGITRADLMTGGTEYQFMYTLEVLRAQGHKIICRQFRNGVKTIYYRCEEFAAVVDKAKADHRSAMNRARHKAKAMAKPRVKPYKPRKTRAQNAAANPITIVKPKQAPAKFSGEVDYSRAVVTVAPTPKPRFAVELGNGHVSALDPRECRPWAMAAVRQPVTAAIQPGDYLIG